MIEDRNKGISDCFNSSHSIHKSLLRSCDTVRYYVDVVESKKRKTTWKQSGNPKSDGMVNEVLFVHFPSTISKSMTIIINVYILHYLQIRQLHTASLEAKERE